MAKIRAYKLAEELGIDRSDIVERAGAVGIELKSPMSSLDDEEAEQLREKLGKPSKPKGEVVERRVEGRGGATIIRRKRKKAPEPEPEPEPVAEEPEAVEAPAEAAEAEPEATPEPEAVPEPVAAEAPEEAVAAASAEQAPEAPKGPAADSPGEAPAGPAGATGAPAGERKPPGPSTPDSAKPAKPKKAFREVVNLREQEQLARQATTRTTQRRPVTTVDPRAFQSPRRKRRDAAPKKAAPAPAAASKVAKIVRVEGEISVAELAKQLGAKAAEVQGKLMGFGTMVGINQTIDSDVARKVADAYGAEVQDTGFKEEEALASVRTGEVDESALEGRPPVITVMGHVDHGKTSLLDALREANVVAGEAGGITQHIGAYQTEIDGAKLTFIDTPGHAAFTEMRARGAQITDIVILIVAASEGVMPQTEEAISHAKAAGVPILVAINKCDLPGADPTRTRQSLLEHDLVPEEFGGDVITVEISALKKTGLDKLLELLALQAEVLELKADPNQPATGVVLEAELDKGRGPVATVLVKEGTLRRGDAMVVGTSYGRIRAMQDENGKRLNEAPPSTPVQVIGLSSVPGAGEVFHVAESERAAKDVAEHREDQQRGRVAGAPAPRRSLEDLFAQAGEGGMKELNVVLKADVQGSLEAVRDALVKLGNDEVKVEVLHAGVGGITENDVNLAQTGEAIVVGFNVRPDPAARKAADSTGVDMRMYRVIYELTDEVKLAMAGLLPPRIEENALGRAEVRETFTVPKIGTIAGCYMVEGKAQRNAKCRLVRDGVVVHEGQLGSLRRFKDDVREVQTGFECGIGIDGYGDVKVGDVIEIYVLEERAATLE